MKRLALQIEPPDLALASDTEGVMHGVTPDGRIALRFQDGPRVVVVALETSLAKELALDLAHVAVGLSREEQARAGRAPSGLVGSNGVPLVGRKGNVQ